MKLRKINTVVMGLVLLSGTAVWAAEAKKEAAKSDDKLEVTVSPEIRYVWVSGDENQFRQDQWINDKLSGGIQSLKLLKKLQNDWTLSLDGRALFDEHDYQIRLEIANPNVGFLRAGYTEFRKYFDDSGGFYKFTNPVAGAKFFALGQELNLDISDLYVELGLTLPNWPKIMVGFERKAKDGDKSMVEWGGVQFPVSGTTTNRGIYPAYKAIDDKVNIIKVDIEHDISNVHLGNQFRYEHYKNVAFRLDDSTYIATNVAPGKIITVNEGYQHDAFMNTFYMDSHVNDQVYWSMGYLYSTLDGAPSFDMNTAVYPQYQGSSSGTDKFWALNSANLDSDSHVLNGNVMFGPFFKKSTYVYGGIQAEKTEADMTADIVLAETEAPNEAALVETSSDKTWFEERLGVRFVGIPFTTLYAEGKWTHGNIGLGEREFITGVSDATIASELEQRDVDTDVTRQDYRVGFNTSPIAKVNLSAYYRKNMRQNDYNDYEMDVITTYTNGTMEAEIEEGYITRQSIDTDEVAVKLTLRPHAKLGVSLKYQYVDTTIYTEFGNSALSNETGDYKSSIYSVSATVMPINQMYCTAMFSYQDTRTIGRANGAPMVTVYGGDVLSVLAAVGYAFDNKTDAQVDYSYSSAHNGQSSVALAGLPLGTDYERHGVSVRLSRQIRDNIGLSLRYGYYDLKDGAVAGNNDYSAHLLSGSCTIRF